MPLRKTMSGASKQRIRPKTWTLVSFAGDTVMGFAPEGWTLVGVLLRVEYPRQGCPSTLRGRFMRWPDTKREDATGFDDKDPLPGMTRHHYWSHFVKNQAGLEVGFKVWHNGTSPIVLDGRQFKWTRFN